MIAVLLSPLPGGEFMPAYRLYHVDGAGKILSAEWLQESDDEAAIEAARASSNGGACELWQQQRLVARIGRDGTTSLDRPR